MDPSEQEPSTEPSQATPEFDNETHETAHFRLERSALIETCANSQYIYGCWATVFGAWGWRADGRKWRPIVPNFSLVNRHGQPFGSWGEASRGTVQRCTEDPPDFDLDHPWDRLDDIAWTKRATVARYAEKIPAPYRRIVGRLAHPRSQWLVLGAIRADPSIADLVHKELDAAGHKYLEACLILDRSTSIDCRRLASFVREVLTTPRHEILSRLSSVPVARSAVKLLSKYEWIGYADSDELRSLFVAARLPKQGRILRRRPRINRGLVQISDHIEEPFERAGWLRNNSRIYPGLASFLFRCLLEAHACYRLMEKTKNFRTTDWRERALAAIDRSVSLEGMLRGLRAIAMDSFRSDAVWNVGPWSGSQDFSRVTRFEELIMIARAFQNCVPERANLYATGQAHLYVTPAAPINLIEIRQTEPDGRWSIVECQTRGQASVDPRVLRSFARDFERATGQHLVIPRHSHAADR